MNQRLLHTKIVFSLQPQLGEGGGGLGEGRGELGHPLRTATYIVVSRHWCKCSGTVRDIGSSELELGQSQNGFQLHKNLIDSSVGNLICFEFLRF